MLDDAPIVVVKMEHKDGELWVSNQDVIYSGAEVLPVLEPGISVAYGIENAEQAGYTNRASNITLHNHSGLLDDITGHNFAGHDVILYTGDLSSGSLVLTARNKLINDGISSADEGSVTFSVSTYAFVMEKNVQESFFDESLETLGGQPIPIAFGRCRGCECPVTSDVTNRWNQWATHRVQYRTFDNTPTTSGDSDVQWVENIHGGGKLCFGITPLTPPIEEYTTGFRWDVMDTYMSVIADYGSGWFRVGQRSFYEDAVHFGVYITYTGGIPPVEAETFDFSNGAVGRYISGNGLTAFPQFGPAIFYLSSGNVPSVGDTLTSRAASFPATGILTNSVTTYSNYFEDLDWQSLPVRFDIQGARRLFGSGLDGPFPAGPQYNKPWNVLMPILNRVMDDSLIDTDSVWDFSFDTNYRLGMYVTEPTNVNEILKKFFPAGVLFGMNTESAPKFEIKNLPDPSTTTAIRTLGNIVEGSVEIMNIAAPAWRVLVKSSPNHSPINERFREGERTEPAEWKYYKKQTRDFVNWRWASDSSVRTGTQNAKELVFETHINTNENGGSQANYGKFYAQLLLALYKLQRTTFQLILLDANYVSKVGDVVEVPNDEVRYELGGNGTVLFVEEFPGLKQTRLVLWK